MVIIDGTNTILGRLASKIAKMLIQGNNVHLINAEKIIVSGSPKKIIDNYVQKRRLQHKGTPEYSPKWPRFPDLMVRRVIRGMLPFKKAKGKTAFKRLKVYIGKPDIKGEVIFLKEVLNKGLSHSISIGKMCQQLGAKW